MVAGKWALLVCFILSTSGAAAAPTVDMPAIEDSESIHAQAEVIAVDKKTREVRLKTPSGEIFSVIAGDEVKNFAQIKKGDTLNVNYLAAITWQLKKGGEPSMTVKETTAEAAPGEKPGAIALSKVTAQGTVVSVDKKAQNILVKGPKRTVRLRVPNPDVLNKVKVGDQVEATFTEALAVSIEKTKKH